MPENDILIEFSPRLRFYFGKSDEHFIAAGNLTYLAEHAHRLGTAVGFPDFRFLYLLEGEGLFVPPNGERIRLAAGDLVCRRPNVDNMIQPNKGRRWREFYFAMPTSLYTMAVDAGLMPSRDHYRIGIDASMKAAMSAILTSVRHARSFAGLLPDIIDLLSYMKTRADNVEFDRRSRRSIDTAKRILSANIERNISMEKVARASGMGYEAFRKRFRDVVGIAPKEFRLRKKLSAAAALLLDGHHTISEISERFGYPDIFCFSRQFKAHFRYTPSMYRRLYR
ncbi:MAG: AraC family transcriptional regulator [Spirochaetota bacterium]